MIGTLLSTTTSQTPTDAETVAMVILAESRGEGQSGMYAIACVIKQRMIDRNLTPKQVSLQAGQFATPKRRFLESPAAPYAMLLANTLCSGGKIDRSFANNANHFCTIKSNPYWAKNRKPVKIIGNHKFFKL